MRYLLFLIAPLFCDMPQFDQSLSPLIRTGYETENYSLVTQKEALTIPKIIHQIWIGGEPPENCQKLMATWKELHPDWDYRLWTDEDIASFNLKNKTLFDACTNLGMKADIWRYEILHRYGGLYVDVDFECIRRFDVLHHSHSFYAGLDPWNVINNAIIASAKHSPIMLRCITSLSELDPKNLTPDQKEGFFGVQQTTGPTFLTNIVLSCIQDGYKGAVIYPQPFFFPYIVEEKTTQTLQGNSPHIDEVIEAVHKTITPETFAIHYWACTWVTS